LLQQSSQSSLPSLGENPRGCLDEDCNSNGALLICTGKKKKKKEVGLILKNAGSSIIFWK